MGRSEQKAESATHGYSLSLLVTASDDENANKRAGHRIDAHGRTQTVARNGHSPGKRPRQLAEEEGRRPGAAAAARNCKSARERGKVQSLRCPHSSAEQTQTRMRTPRMLLQ